MLCGSADLVGGIPGWIGAGRTGRPVGPSGFADSPDPSKPTGFPEPIGSLGTHRIPRNPLDPSNPIGSTEPTGSLEAHRISGANRIPGTHRIPRTPSDPPEPPDPRNPSDPSNPLTPPTQPKISLFIFLKKNEKTFLLYDFSYFNS